MGKQIKMKYFIVSEMELKQKIDKLQGTYHNTMDLVEASSLVEEMLADKQPVEMIAEGEFDRTDRNYGSGFVGEDNLISKFDKYEGKSIKIFIQEVK